MSEMTSSVAQSEGDGLDDAADLEALSSRVLLAEDDDELRRLLAQALRRDRHVVIEARNGLELLSAIGSASLVRPEEQHVDLVISDIRMPGATGLDALRLLRLYSPLVPMILITAFGDEETRAEASRWGADAVFDKPLDIDELRATVWTFLQQG